MNDWIVEGFGGTVRYNAAKLSRNLPKHAFLDQDDLEQEGWLSILEAARKNGWDSPELRTHYAEIRATGGMIDALRKTSFFTKYYRDKVKKDPEAAGEVFRDVASVRNRKAVVYKKYRRENGLEEPINFSSIADHFNQIVAFYVDPVCEDKNEERLEAIQLLSKLNRRERKAVVMEAMGFTQLEIGNEWSVSASRVSQIRARVHKKMQGEARK